MPDTVSTRSNTFRRGPFPVELVERRRKFLKHNAHLTVRLILAHEFGLPAI